MHKHVLPQTVNLPSPSVAHREDGVGGEIRRYYLLKGE